MIINDDQDFLLRAYRLSVWLWGTCCAILLALQGWQSAVGWTLGCGMSVAVVRSLEIVIRRSFVPGNPNAKRAINRAYAARLPITLGSLVVVVLLGRNCMAFLAAFGAGILLVQSAMVLRTATQVVAQYARDRK